VEKKVWNTYISKEPLEQELLVQVVERKLLPEWHVEYWKLAT